MDVNFVCTRGLIEPEEAERARLFLLEKMHELLDEKRGLRHSLREKRILNVNLSWRDRHPNVIAAMKINILDVHVTNDAYAAFGTAVVFLIQHFGLKYAVLLGGEGAAAAASAAA